METANSRPSIAWWLCGISTLGMVVFATLYFEQPRPTSMQVKQSTDIPQGYTQAMLFVSNYNSANFIKEAQLLSGIRDVRVNYTITNIAKNIIIEDELKAKFELELRKSGVSIDPQSGNFLNVILEGVDDSGALGSLVAFDFHIYLFSVVTLNVNHTFHQASVAIWQQGYHGVVGQIPAHDYILTKAEMLGDMFANDYLTANPQTH